MQVAPDCLCSLDALQIKLLCRSIMSRVSFDQTRYRSS